MRKPLQKLSHPRLVFIITFIAISFTAILDLSISSVLGHQYILEESFIRVMSIPLIIAPSVSCYLVGFMFNLDRIEKKMNRLAIYDDLTGLLTGRAFYHFCESMHTYSIRNKQNYCLLIICLDKFKQIND